MGAVAVFSTALGVGLSPTASTYSLWTSNATANTASVILFNPAPPEITTTSIPNFVVGATYSQQLTVISGSAVTWSLDDDSGPLPAGVTLSDSGLISGTPTAGYANNAAQTLIFNASNAGGSDSVSITVSAFIAPPVGSTINSSATVNKTYSYQFPKSGNPAPTFSISSGSLPTGLTLSTTGLVSGTVTSTANTTATIKATNSVGSSTYTLNIAVYTTPVITTTAFENPTQGVDYSDYISPYGDPIYSITAGALPSGITMDSYGYISGIAKANGTFTFTITAKNQAGQSSKSFTMTIAAPSLGIASPSYIYTGASSALNFTPTNMGDTSNTTFTGSVTSGTIPAGMKLNAADATITGTPTSTTASTVTLGLKAVNAGGAAATKSVRVTLTTETSVALKATYISPGASQGTITGTVGKPLNIKFTGGVSGSSLRGYTSTKAPGLRQSSDYRHYYGVPTKAGSYTWIMYQLIDESDTSKGRFYYKFDVTIS